MIIKCHECGKEVSDGAKKCPHCGCKVKSKKKSKKKIVALVIALIIAAFAALGLYKSYVDWAARQAYMQTDEYREMSRIIADSQEINSRAQDSIERAEENREKFDAIYGG